MGIAARCLGTLLLLAARGALCDASQLPAVPSGGTLHVTFAISPAIPGIPITLTVPLRCGSFVGGDSIVVTTDASGSASFDFIAGPQTTVCYIQGQYQSYFGSVWTTVYRPDDVELTCGAPLQAITVNGTGGFSLQAKAKGLALWGIPASIDQPPSGGASGSARFGFGPSTQQDGSFSVVVAANGTPGVYDLFAHAGSATQRLRVNQSLPVAPLPPTGRSMPFTALSGGDGPTRLSILQGAPACVILSAGLADYAHTLFGWPPHTTGFPMTGFSAMLQPCDGTVQLALEFSRPVDPSWQLWMLNVTRWVPVPSSASGNTVTFSVANNGEADGDSTTSVIAITGGLAQPGEPLPQRPVPAVQDMWWAGPAENGWGMSLAQSTDGKTMFGGVYGYGADGRPTWWVMSGGVWDTALAYQFTGDLLTVRGTPWYAYEARFVVPRVTGPGKLLFDTPDAGTFDFTIDGVAMHKAIVRQPFGAGGSSPAGNVSGMWWGGPALNGWGIAVMQQQSTLFSVWYTYDDQGYPTWFVLPGGAWTSATTYEGRIYRTTGSPLLGQAYDASKLTVTDVGPYRLRFANGTAILDYAVDGKTGTLSMVHQPGF